MIKTNFKLIAPVLAAAILGAALLVSPAFAQTNSSTDSANLHKGKTCAVYSDRATKIAERAAATQAKIDAARANQLTKLNNNRAKNDKKIADDRLNADQKRAQALTKLLSKASTTDVQKAAIATFQTSLNQAVTARRAAIDAAIAAYRTAVDQLKASHQINVDQATTTYQAAVTAAYAKALADCQANVDPKTVRTNLNAALKAAKQAYDASRQSLAGLQSIIGPLAKTRQQAIAAAESTFKTTVTSATTALKAAFPNKPCVGKKCKK